MTDELVAFIHARLDEDETVARAAAMDSNNRGEWTQVDPDRCPGAVNDADGVVVVYDEGSPDVREAAHIARFDPARALRGVGAKRRILVALNTWEHARLYDGTDENAGPYSCTRDGLTCECGVLDHQLDVLRPMASVWSTYPDYREEWP